MTMDVILPQAGDDTRGIYIPIQASVESGHPSVTLPDWDSWNIYQIAIHSVSIFISPLPVGTRTP